MLKKLFSKTRNIVIVLVSFLFVLTSILVGVSYAVSMQTVRRTQEVEIRSRQIKFLFNGKSYYDTLGVTDLNLRKGEPCDVTMNVSVVGTNSTSVIYGIYFSFQEEEGISQAVKNANQLVAMGTAVYTLKNGNYYYVDQLNNLLDTETAPISGTMSTSYSEDVDLRFVYVGTGSKESDDIVSLASFSVKANATFNFDSSSSYVYVNSEDEFLRASAHSEDENKTIVLVDDITLQNPVNITQKVGIDLKGHTLTLNGNVNISYSSSTNKELGIIDSRGTGSILGSGIVSVTGDDTYYVGKNLKSKVSINLSNVSVYNDYINKIQTRINTYFINNTYAPGSDLSFIFTNLEYYLDKYTYSLQADDNFIVKDSLSIDNPKYLYLSTDTDVISSSKYYFNLSISDTIGTGGVTIIPITLNVTGNDFLSLGQQIASTIPSVISSSLYLPSYDQLSGTYFDYIIEDNASGILLDNNGLYHSKGLDRVYALDDYSNRDVTIYIKMSKSDDFYSDDDAYYYKVERQVRALTLEEKSNLWLDGEEIILSKNNVTSYSIDTSLIPSKVGLTSYTFSFENNTDQVYNYLTLSNSNTVCNLNLELSIPDSLNASGNLLVTLVYGEDTIVKKIPIRVVGSAQYVVQYDVQYKLQSSFNNNAYIDDLNNKFLVYGSLAPRGTYQYSEVLIDYKIIGDAHDYVSVTYDYYLMSSDVEDQIAYYLKNGDNYYFVANTNSIVTQPSVDAGYSEISHSEMKNGLTYYTKVSSNNYEPVTINNVENDIDENTTYYRLLTKITYIEDNNINLHYTYYTLENGNFTPHRFTSLSEVDANETYYRLVDKGTSGATVVDIDLYTYRSEIEVLLAKVPSEEGLSATVQSVLYTLKKDGTIYYLDDGVTYGYLGPGKDESVAENWEEVKYVFTFDIEGIIHNDENGIYDYALYNALISLYDSNGDNLLTISEAKQVLPNSSFTKRYYNSKNYYALDLGAKNISSLKGIEFFENVPGIYLKTNNVSDLTPVQNLRQLLLLEVHYNSVTNLSPLGFLDNLEVLNLKYNTNLTNISILENLTSLKVIDLTGCKVTDFSPLTKLTNLVTLDVSNMTTSAGGSFNSSSVVKYNMALILNNNPSLTEIEYVNSKTGDTVITLTDEERVASSAMKSLEDINRVKKTLYLPKTYIFNGKEYTLQWSIENASGGTNANIILLNNTNTNVQDYIIESPIFNRELKFLLQVTYGDTTYNVSRVINVTLEKSLLTSDVYIYNGSEYINIYDEATDTYTIEDVSLRNLLFDYLNIDKSDSSVPNCAGTEANTISSADLASSSISKKWNFASTGITSLTGLRILQYTGLSGITLDLSGNDIDDATLEEFKYLNGVFTTIILGGKEYDLSYLADTSITDLSVLDVSTCFDINSDEALENLYQIYLNNTSVSIYIDAAYDDADAEVWDPYADELPKKISNLQTIFTVAYLNETINVYHPDSETGDNGFKFNFYNHELTFTISNYKLLVLNNSIGDWKSSRYFSVNSTTGLITYLKILGVNESSYVYFEISYTDNHDYQSVGKYYIQIIAEDLSSTIVVHNYESNFPDTNVNQMTLGELYGNPNLRRKLISSLYTSTWLKNASLSYSGTLEEFLVREANPSNAANPYYYYDSISGLYHITINMLGEVEFDQASFIAGSGGGRAQFKTPARKPYSSSNYPHVSMNNTSENGRSSIYGLRYLKNLTILELFNDGAIGTGEELVNIEHLYYRWSYIDLTSLSVELPNLKTLYCINSHFLFVTEDIISSYLYNLTYFGYNTEYKGDFRSIKDLSFLKGFIYQENGVKYSKLTGLHLNYAFSSDKWDSVGFSGSSAAVVYEVYKAAYDKLVADGSSSSAAYNALYYAIGTPSKNSDNSTWFVTDFSTGSMGCSTTRNSASSSWSGTWSSTTSSGQDVDTSSTDYINDGTEFTNVMSTVKDMGLQLNGSSWSTNRTFELTSGDVIILPTSTFNIYYGLEYEDGTTFNDYPIDWYYTYVNSGTTSYSYQELSDFSSSSSFTSATGITCTYDEDNKKYTLTISSSNNGYLVLLGIVQGTNAYSQVTQYYYGYNFVVNNGDGLFSEIIDPFVRYGAFAKVSGGYNTALANSSSNSYNAITTLIYDYHFKTKGSSYYSSSYGSNVISNDMTYKVYSFEGLDKYYNNCYYNSKKIGNLVKTIDISNSCVTDISSMVDGLVASGASHLTTFKAEKTTIHLPSNFNQLSYIKTLDLKYSIDIDYDDLCIVYNNGNPMPIDNLNIYNTRCDFDYKCLSIIRGLAANVSKLKIYWNSSSSTTFQGTTEIDDFIDFYSNVGSNIVTQMVTSGSSTYEGDGYTVTSENIVNAITNASFVSNGDTIDVKVYVSSDSVNCLSHLYKTVTYETSTDTQYTTNYIGSGYQTINNYDSELIFGLYNSGYLTLSNGHYQLTQDVYIQTGGHSSLGSSYMYGINTLKGFDSISISNNYLKLTSNYLSYSIYLSLQNKDDRSNRAFWSLIQTLPNGSSFTSLYSLPGTNYSTEKHYYNNTGEQEITSLAESSIFDINNSVIRVINQDTTNASYTVVRNSSEKYYMTLPSIIYVKGVACPITYRINSNFCNSLAQSSLSTFEDAFTVDGAIIELDTSKLTGLTANVYQVGFSYSTALYGENIYDGWGHAIYFYITRVNDGDDDINQMYTLYVEVNYDSSLNGYVILDQDNENIKSIDGSDYLFTSSEVKAVYESEGTHTFDVQYDGNLEPYDPVAYVVNAIDVFSSPSFIKNFFSQSKFKTTSSGGTEYRSDQGIYEDFFSNYTDRHMMILDTNSYIYKMVGSTNAVNGLFLTNTLRLSITKLNFFGSNSSATHSNTSTGGLQIFSNLEEVRFSGGQFIEIEFMRYMKKLNTFNYSNTRISETNVESYAYSDIQDFSPMIEGCKDTLTKFAYDGLNSCQLTDLSFLLSFTNLQYVVLGGFKSDTISIGYYNTSSFQYLLQKLNDKGVGVYIGSPNYNSSYNKSDLDWTVNTSQKANKSLDASFDGMTAYKAYIVAGSEQEKANTYLNQFVIQNTYGTLVDDYIINMTTYSEEAGNLTLQLPSAIEVNGMNYIITWESGNYNISIGSYYLNNDITIGETTYSKGDITTEQAKTILASVEYYSLHKAGKVDVTCSIGVSRQNITHMMNVKNAYIYARIDIDERTFDRVFNLQVS